MNSIIAMLWVAMALFVLFDTSAVYEYFKVLRIPTFISHMRQYADFREQEDAEPLSYGDYMRRHHDSFVVRWATCPYCIGTALAVGATLVFSNWIEIPITYLGGMLCYRAFVVANRWLLERSHG